MFSGTVRFADLYWVSNLISIREDKRGHIDNMNLPLLERLNISPENWLKLTTQFTRVFHGAVGRPTSQVSYCENLKRKRRSNISNCEKLLA
ncbi:hypothetical protein AN393_03931 [Pseudoalteromonas sp. P1-25]|nr:hypothetical protein AN393_03931 [Pseudoalteromonas sp. P1-25]